MPLEWTAEQVFGFLAREFPQALRPDVDYRIVELEPERTLVRVSVGEAQLRPGGTVSGPVIMELVDFAVYFLLLAHHREKAKLSVTTGLTISFLRKPAPGALLADARFIKHGRTLTVARVDIRSEGSDALVASSEATYYTGNI